MEYTERTENTMVNLLVMGATVARWIRGRSELRAEDFREKSSKVGLRHKVSEKSAETEKASENSLFKKKESSKAPPGGASTLYSKSAVPSVLLRDIIAHSSQKEPKTLHRR